MRLKSLQIRNYKTIEDLELDLRRVNLFIGPPGSGKTAIIEAVGLLGEFYDRRPLAEAVLPIPDMETIFRNPKRPVEISVVRSDLSPYDLRYTLTFRLIDNYVIAERDGLQTTAVLGRNDSVRCYLKDEPYTDVVRFACVDARIVTSEIEALAKKRDYLREIMARYGEDRVERLPEPIKRYVAYLAVIDEVPEGVIAINDFTCCYQPLTKLVAERIARSSAQYLIETYDPQAVISVAEKMKVNDLNIYLVRQDDGKTSARRIDPKEVVELGYDLFFNLYRWGVKE
jgi:hypothetical protein